MIRIETTAEFDVEGRFTVSGQTSAAIEPGSHRVVVVVDDPIAEPESPTPEPPLKKVGNVLVFAGKMLEDPEVVRQRLDDESTRRMLEGPFE